MHFELKTESVKDICIRSIDFTILAEGGVLTARDESEGNRVAEKCLLELFSETPNEFRKSCKDQGYSTETSTALFDGGEIEFEEIRYPPGGLLKIVTMGIVELHANELRAQISKDEVARWFKLENNYSISASVFAEEDQESCLGRQRKRRPHYVD